MRRNQGFTLIETMVALIILSLIALMASQGLSSAFRIKNKVEHEILNHESFVTMMKYIQNDCEAIVKNSDEKLPPTFVNGNKFVWLMRHYSSREINGWQIVGYTVEKNTLKRFVSDTFSSSQESARLLETLSKDPDLGLSFAQLTYQLDGVTKQNIQAFWGSFSNKSPIGLNISLSLINSEIPLTNSCIVEGRL
jgi:prepilin-type N-terminal cleavage/methylation domain-containing protein